jgi:hypothetical protein
VARVLQVFLSSTGACRTTHFGSHASSAHPQFMRTPCWRGLVSGQNSALLYTAQGHAWMKFSALPLSVWPTASISESGSNGSGSCREAVKEVEKPMTELLPGKLPISSALILLLVLGNSGGTEEHLVSDTSCATSTHLCCKVPPTLWNATCWCPASTKTPEVDTVQYGTPSTGH